jgi:hypothetical protein
MISFLAPVCSTQSRSARASSNVLLTSFPNGIIDCSAHTPLEQNLPGRLRIARRYTKIVRAFPLRRCHENPRSVAFVVKAGSLERPGLHASAKNDDGVTRGGRVIDYPRIRDSREKRNAKVPYEPRTASVIRGPAKYLRRRRDIDAECADRES